MDPTTDALLQDALRRVKRPDDRLVLLLESQLVAAITFPEPVMPPDLAEALRDAPPLSAEDEAVVQHLTWRPVAQTCIVAVLHELFDRAESANPSAAVVSDDEIRNLSEARIASPEGMRRLGLETPHAKRAAELTAELFNDRTQFVEPTAFTRDGRAFTIHRQGDSLAITAA